MKPKNYSPRWQLFEWTVKLLETVWMPQFVMFLNKVFKPNTRPLSEREIALAKTVFAESIDYQKVRVDDQAKIACRDLCLAYVGFNVINSWGQLSDAHFIHEMVHVWQYQYLGAAYIPRALHAQTTLEGYNYGGIKSLKNALREGRGFLSFNYEQQGDIVADYFRLKTGRMPQWCEPNPAHLPVFEQFIAEMLSLSTRNRPRKTVAETLA